MVTASLVPCAEWAVEQSNIPSCVAVTGVVNAKCYGSCKKFASGNNNRKIM